MLRTIKKRLLEIVQSMEEALCVLKGQICGAGIEGTACLLSQMQEAALSVGTAVEESEGEGSAVVSRLEESCELLWELSQTGELNAAPGQKAFKHLADKRGQLIKQLETCLSCVKEELEGFSKQYRAVFLPYQASMWDSMESVWLAAMEDPDCISYVMPVPYYDKNADGSLGEQHYDGNRFPNTVPITDYRLFDLETQRPDVIYFHNPYDEANYVTGLHPSYYSSELKKYTDMLVYIPYFVSFDNVEEHFCCLPGVMNADRVIVQSEKVRETYIRCYVKTILKDISKGKTELSSNRASLQRYERELKKMAEEKFLALGSPKFDKVMNTRREDLLLPEEWKRKIERPDGTRRKVLLYNVTLDGILRHEEQMLKKIESVFSLIRQAEDVLLLWRPHPLIESTVALMRPELYRKYRELVKWYRNEDFGIFDDTPDLHRAIALSDAYFGDGGSLIALYRASGKPIMLQNVEALLE